MLKYAFWNNKGGTGKTSLCFQSLTFYAHQNPEKKILAVDVCPQANLSELLLGGLTGSGSANLLALQNNAVRQTVGGYFESRLSSPFTPPAIAAAAYTTVPSQFNPSVPMNIDLIAGDPLLELQSQAISTLSNANIPTANSWLAVIDWLGDLLDTVSDQYDVVFIDANPSFSVYTQIALSCADRLVLPVMADDSSRRAIQNAFSLVFGLRLPSAIYSQYAFATKLTAAGRALPQVHKIAKNRLTQYMGSASAYSAVLTSIDSDVTALLATNPSMFTASAAADVVVDIRDFQTAGVVSFARGNPLYAQAAGRMDVLGRRVQVKRDYLENCIASVQGLVDHL